MSINRSLLSVPLRFSLLLLLFFQLSGTQVYAVNPDVSNSEEAIAAGKTVFNANCRTCHRLDSKNVGPALRGVTDRHSAPWIMNFTTNTDAMLNKDPKAQAQLEICLVRMPNQNIADVHQQFKFSFCGEFTGVIQKFSNIDKTGIIQN